MVTDTLTSEVVTTSTGVLALEDLEQAAQEAVRHQHPRRRDVDDGDVALAGKRGSGPSWPSPPAVMSVPGASGGASSGCGRESLRTAGRMVLGCSTLAPK